jgi:alpha-glucosidase (family GH31 glycosyl hydrolase)
MLPLWVNFPKDKKVFKTEDSYMIGNGLFVYPITEADTNQVSIYFPGENTVRKMNNKKILYFIYFKRFGMILEHLLNIMVLKQYL